MIEYELIRSRRRTVSLEITDHGRVLVRAPKRLPKYEIERFILEKSKWIDKHMAIVKARNEKLAHAQSFDETDIKRLTDKARQVIPEKVAYYAEVLGVTYGRITIRNQKTLWGSCTSKGNLNFNCKLMLVPEHVLDYVVVHELCHRKEMNHSKAFWALVGSIIPDYKACRKWLKDEGTVLLR